MCVSVYMCVWVLLETRDLRGIPGAGVTGDSEPPGVGAGNWTLEEQQQQQQQQELWPVGHLSHPKKSLPLNNASKARGLSVLCLRFVVRLNIEEKNLQNTFPFVISLKLKKTVIMRAHFLSFFPLSLWWRWDEPRASGALDNPLYYQVTLSTQNSRFMS